MTKFSLVNNAYGAVYFDPLTRRYLRVAAQKISNDDYLNKNWVKDFTIIIMDEFFQIVGESSFDKNLNPYTMLVTPSGIYAPTREINNEDELNFVRLAYE